ncbi:low molecular weight phosphatase family protein [Mycolicibacterium sphagni]|nr:low molecular weight phosphatase family protein [Mycolicibacterium sphagni]
MHILFVCTGNICRSPTAERLAAAYAAQAGIQQLQLSSAGTRAVIGHAMHPEAAQVLETYGGDPSDFVARQLTPRIVSGADLVLTMTRAQRDIVLEQVPRQLRRTFTLAETSKLVTAHGAKDVADLAALRPSLPSDHQLDIADPIGLDSEFFSAVGAQIAEFLPSVLRLVSSPTAPTVD